MPENNLPAQTEFATASDVFGAAQAGQRPVKIYTLSERVNHLLYQAMGIASFAGIGVILEAPFLAPLSLATACYLTRYFNAEADESSHAILSTSDISKFPEDSQQIYQIAQNYAQRLGMKEVPDILLISKTAGLYKSYGAGFIRDPNAVWGTNNKPAGKSIAAAGMSKLARNFANAFSLGTMSRSAVCFAETLLDNLTPQGGALCARSRNGTPCG